MSFRWSFTELAKHDIPQIKQTKKKEKKKKEKGKKINRFLNKHSISERKQTNKEIFLLKTSSSA